MSYPRYYIVRFLVGEPRQSAVRLWARKASHRFRTAVGWSTDLGMSTAYSSAQQAVDRAEGLPREPGSKGVRAVLMDAGPTAPQPRFAIVWPGDPVELIGALDA